MTVHHPDLFAAPYPSGPGHKGGDTSRGAAAGVAPGAKTLREMVLRGLKRRGPSTPEEMAVWLRVDLMSIRPRFSELSATGAIEDTGERRQSRCGKRAKVWRATPALQEPQGRPPAAPRGATDGADEREDREKTVTSAKEACHG